MAANSFKLIVQKQHAGTITGHKYNLLHAVIKLHRGVRYSLVVVDCMNRNGEKDVHCVDADIVRRILDLSSSMVVASEKRSGLRETPTVQDHDDAMSSAKTINIVSRR